MGEKLVNEAERHEAVNERISELHNKEDAKHDKKIDKVIDKTVDKVINENNRHDNRIENIEEKYEKGLEKLSEKEAKKQDSIANNTTTSKASVNIETNNATSSKTNIEINVNGETKSEAVASQEGQKAADKTTLNPVIESVSHQETIQSHTQTTTVYENGKIVEGKTETEVYRNGTLSVNGETIETPKQNMQAMKDEYAQSVQAMKDEYAQSVQEMKDEYAQNMAETQAELEQYVQEGYTKVPHGVYKIGENGTFNYSCINCPRAAINLLPDEIRSSTDPMASVHAGSELYMKTQAYRDLMGQENLTPGETKFVEDYKELLKEYRLSFDGNVLERGYNDSEVHRVDGVKYQFNENGVNISTNTNLSEIEQENKVYIDILERSEKGEMRFGAEERKFIQEHKDNMAEQNLYHTADGNLVKLSDDITVTPKGTAYSIGEGGVKEEGIYGYKNSMKDFLTEAKNCLGEDAKAKEVLEFKTFLIQDEIYKDITSKEASGVEFTAEQKESIAKFKQQHEEKFSALQEKHNLERGDNGKIAVSQNTTQTAETTKVQGNVVMQNRGGAEL